MIATGRGREEGEGEGSGQGKDKGKAKGKGKGQGEAREERHLKILPRVGSEYSPSDSGVPSCGL